MRVYVLLMIGLLAGVPAAIAQEKPGEAEKLLLELERKLLDTKTLRITFQVDEFKFFPKDKSNLKGTLEVAEKNRCRTEVELGLADKAAKKQFSGYRFLEVSDGIKNRILQFDAHEAGKVESMVGRLQREFQPIEAVPKAYNETLLKIVARYGMLDAYDMTRDSAAWGEFDDRLPEFIQSKFKAARQEMLNGKKALIIEFDVSQKDRENSKTNIITPKKRMVLWLDADTKLPMRRLIETKNDKGVLSVVETYQIDMNPRIDGKRFELPKEKQSEK